MASIKSVAELFNKYWKWRLRRTPEFATLAGEKTHDSDLEEFTLERFIADRETCKQFLEQSFIVRTDDLDATSKLHMKLFRLELQTFIDGFSCYAFLNPINNIEGIQVDFARLGSEWMDLKTVEDYQNWISRLEKFPALADQISEMLKLSVKEKKTNHHFSMFAVPDQLSKLQGDPRSTTFFQSFVELPSEFDAKTVDELREDAEKVIRDSIQPALARLAKCIEEDYIPFTRPDIGINSLPNGGEFYSQCLKFHTSSEKYSPDLIHKIGLSEVERIEADMRKVIEEIGFDGNLREFVSSIRKDPKLTFKSGKELFDYFSHIVYNVISPKLKDYFLTEPTSKLVVTETPSNQSEAPAAFYIAGTSDGSRPGKVFVNCSSPERKLRCGLVSLALHEGNPGHHLQASYMLEQQNLPKFMRYLEDRNYFQAPSRFPIHTAYEEGWALYCEKLGFDMGLYNDPYVRFGHFSEEMFRACRLVVDTGIHAFGWSRDRAIQFMLDHTATPKLEIENEINRYITWPGQAVAYKIGELRISELRKKSERALGVRFDIKEFHEVVLRTPGPLDLVEEEVDSFIAKKKQKI